MSVGEKPKERTNEFQGQVECGNSCCEIERSRVAIQDRERQKVTGQ